MDPDSMNCVQAETIYTGKQNSRPSRQEEGRGQALDQEPV